MIKYYIVTLDGKAITTGYITQRQEVATIHSIEYFENYTEYINKCNQYQLDPIEEATIEIPQKITNAQGRFWLIDNNLFEQVNNYIMGSGDLKLMTMWEYHTDWYYTNKTLDTLAEHFKVDLKKMFTEAANYPK